MYQRSAHIHSASIDLQDVIKEYADDVTKIELHFCRDVYDNNALYLVQNGWLVVEKRSKKVEKNVGIVAVYSILRFAQYVSFNPHVPVNRNLTFIDPEEHALLDLVKGDVPAFVLVNSSLTFVLIKINLPQKAAFAQAQQDSILNITNCLFTVGDFFKPLLCGTRSKLIIYNQFLGHGIFYSSLIEGPDDTADPHLALIMENATFANLENKAQKPVLAGQDVQKVTIFNSKFKELKCTDVGELPTKPVEGVANRSVVMKDTQINYIAGALNGGLVYGLQASFLTYASSYMPNGGVLYLPHDTVNVTMSNSTIYNPTTPDGHGAVIYTTGRSTITVEQCVIDNAEAGKSGAFIYAGKGVDAVTLNNVTFTLSGAQEGGGLINLDERRRVGVLQQNRQSLHQLRKLYLRSEPSGS
ncbi:hypothetical protein BLNAU_3378 [Blattamonas nauphoetae]|uniref:Right handed beta helix domain-containing protein n=1 Tax=Blattamonas nauphoetae TaxID=2049346 RepID=A0ABQ9YCZ9_9EUKA|nr:hypothetical protein BLNAU_3378 [Blattamonas nauphoetae]